MKQFIDNVSFKKLVTEDGTPVNQRRAVVDLDTGNVLGVVSPRYKIVKNSDLLKVITPAMEEYKMETKPVITQSRGGAITYFKFMGEKHQGEINKGDIVRFGFEFFNSYDGSTPIGFHIIALRLVCVNGLVVPKSIKELYMRHSAGANTADVKTSLSDFFPKLKEVTELWKKWVDIHPKPEQLAEVYDGFVSDRHAEEFTTRFNALKNKNLWEFYNILTHYSTHELKTRNKNNHATKQFDFGEIAVNRIQEVFA